MALTLFPRPGLHNSVSIPMQKNDTAFKEFLNHKILT